ncbi:GNAT family N-acetyltransferase [Thermogutta sp.]|uniref:GNAT family N-acetyltransferase n=1 Tax=Thermogutta sp. TaxID=1962930 RepID=UPI00321FAD42
MSEPFVIELTLETPVANSFRVAQVAGMFDLDLQKVTRETITLTIPPQKEDWRLGVIVGPSGSGKSTLARWLFGDRVLSRFSWPTDRPVIDAFPDLSIKQIVGLFTTVGFASPPAWLRPYRLLSNGEKARCDLARALAQAHVCPSAETEIQRWHGLLPPDADKQLPLVVCDEFTSVVDRHVARAIATGIHRRMQRGELACRFVAVTCHYDIIEWLAPDWVIDMATRQFARRCLPPPPITLAIVPCRREAWRAYRRHHYLSGSLPAAAECYLALWQGEAVAFCAVASQVGNRGYSRISRLVVLPEYQGMGIGSAVLDTMARVYRGRGQRIGITTSHPAIIRHCQRSPHWRLVAIRKYGSRGGGRNLPQYRGSQGRAVVSFEYRRPSGPPGKTSVVSRKRLNKEMATAGPAACQLN